MKLKPICADIASHLAFVQWLLAIFIGIALVMGKPNIDLWKTGVFLIVLPVLTLALGLIGGNVRIRWGFKRRSKPVTESEGK